MAVLNGFYELKFLVRMTSFTNPATALNGKLIVHKQKSLLWPQDLGKILSPQICGT